MVYKTNVAWGVPPALSTRTDGALPKISDLVAVSASIKYHRMCKEDSPANPHPHMRTQ